MPLWMLLDFIERALRKIVEARRQNERDKLENDPVDFFDDHFNGMRDNADETDKADDNADQKR